LQASIKKYGEKLVSIRCPVVTIFEALGRILMAIVVCIESCYSFG